MPAAKPLKILHFADAHVDMLNYGRHDPATGLPVRVTDFLAALDQIIDRALAEQVDLVLFAGDAYKDRNPQPTYQREWGQRIMRLSRAGIPTVLLVGNHDVSPAVGRAHTLHEFETLGVPHIHVADRLELLGPDRLGVPVQIISVPWVSYHALRRRDDMLGKELADVLTDLEERVGNALDQLMDEADPALPLILLAHASVQGAAYGSERQVMLGQELVLATSLVRDSRLDYVALGHIHKHQDLSAGGQPPAVYPGSIERIDFGEAKEKKGFVLSEVGKGHTDWQFVPLRTRRFLDFSAEPRSPETFMDDIRANLPDPDDVAGAICRLQVTYAREHESLLDEAALARHFEKAFSFHIAKHRQSEPRSRLGDGVAVETLTPEELLGLYWQTIDLDPVEAGHMQNLVRQVLGDTLAPH